MIENLNELAKFVKGGADVLQKALESDDKVSLEFIDGRFVTDGDLDAMKDTVRKDAKTEGQTIGYDFAMKDLKKDFGIEVEGKDRKVISEAIKSKIVHESGVKPSEKITELETSLSNLRTKYDQDITTKDSELNTYKSKIKDISIMSELQRNAPDIKGLNINQFSVLAKMEYDFDFDDNNTLIAKKNGHIVKDKMEKNIPVKNILTDYATQNGWFGDNGRGGDNESGSNGEFNSINDVYKHMEQNNIDPGSPAGEKLLNEFNTEN